MILHVHVLSIVLTIGFVALHALWWLRQYKTLPSYVICACLVFEYSGSMCSVLTGLTDAAALLTRYVARESLSLAAVAWNLIESWYIAVPIIALSASFIFRASVFI